MLTITATSTTGAIRAISMPRGCTQHGPHPDWPPHEMPSPFLSPEQMERMAWIAWRTQMLQMEHARRQFGRRHHTAAGSRLQARTTTLGHRWISGPIRTQAEAEMLAAQHAGFERGLGRDQTARCHALVSAAAPGLGRPSGVESPGRGVAQEAAYPLQALLITFASFLVLIAGSVGVLTLVFTGLLGGNHNSALLVWIVGIGLALGLPLLGAGIARIAFVNIARPLAQVMSVADAVAGGDLSVRVPEDEAGAEPTTSRNCPRPSTACWTSFSAR